jgi:hypothetical protein
MTLASRLVELQGGLVLRAILTEEARANQGDRPNVRSIA